MKFEIHHHHHNHFYYEEDIMSRFDQTDASLAKLDTAVAAISSFMKNDMPKAIADAVAASQAGDQAKVDSITADIQARADELTADLPAPAAPAATP